MGSKSSFLCFKILSLLNSPQIILVSQCHIFIAGTPLDKGFPGGSDVKNLPAIQETGSVPGPGRSPGEENRYLLQYFHLENSMDRGV